MRLFLTHRWGGHLVARANTHVILVLVGTACNLQRCISGSTNCTDTDTVAEPNQSEEQPYTTSCRDLKAGRYDLHEPLSHSNQRQADEDETFDENSCERKVVRNDSTAMEADDLIGEVRIQTHTGGESDWHIRQKSEQNRAESRDGRSRGN